ncbi:hypothetical protein A3740_16430 [Oleiphilus sp. HI0068]|nr:hypothetical protein A3740_16430 [Oleiphilus sp. HI0068]KZY75816.1 hypothetical protein A3741_01605 [Oleiphilus sp. HI0069]
MSSITINREELYEKVWSKPITKIAADYGVSDSMIIKICKKLGVLRPGAGHWAKVAAGKKVRKLPLGKLPKHCQEEYCLTNYEQHKKVSDQKVKELQHPLVQQELTDEYLIKVEDKLDDPLPLIFKNITSFNNASVSEKLTLKPRAKSHLDLVVTKDTVNRALNIMNAILLAFQKREWNFEIVTEPKLAMQVTVLDEAISFHIEEKIRHIDHVLTEKEIKAKKAGKWIWPPRYDLVASGNLTLQIHAGYRLVDRHSWSDGKVQRVESCLNKFCIALIDLALAIKVDRAKQEERERQWQLEQQRREAIKKARNVETAMREAFEADFAKWEKADRMRQYLDKYEGTLSGRQLSDEEMSKKKAWLLWARNYADLVDPLTQGNDTVLEETEGTNYRYW